MPGGLWPPWAYGTHGPRAFFLLKNPKKDDYFLLFSFYLFIIYFFKKKITEFCEDHRSVGVST